VRTLVIASFVLFFLSVTIPFTSLAAPQQACQPPIPSEVTGLSVEPPPKVGNLFINEVLFNPDTTWNCSESLASTYTPAQNAWVEIYNSQDVAYDLSSVYATLDTGPGTGSFTFPIHSVIAPHSFLVIFPRRDSNFSQSEPSTLRLLISGISVDMIPLPPFMPLDKSYARVTDGGSDWQWLDNPTIGASNPAALQTSISSSTAAIATTIARTPTPKASPTPRHTPTPNTSKKSRSSGGSQQDGPTTDNGGAAQTGSDLSVLIDGTQPAWNKLPVPGSTPSLTANGDTNNASANEPLAVSDDEEGNNTIRNIEMTVLAVLLAGGLFWCWKLFISPALSKQKK
jgi:hypothetical protein